MKKLLLISTLFLCSFLGTAQTAQAEEKAPQKEVPAQQKIKVFPNPASNVVNILGLFNSSKASITILNMKGIIVQKHQWAIQSNALSIPVPNLKSGIYSIRITSQEQQIQTKFYKN